MLRAVCALLLAALTCARAGGFERGCHHCLAAVTVFAAGAQELLCKTIFSPLIETTKRNSIMRPSVLPSFSSVVGFGGPTRA
jgi:hypothetical protein